MVLSFFAACHLLFGRVGEVLVQTDWYVCCPARPSLAVSAGVPPPAPAAFQLSQQFSIFKESSASVCAPASMSIISRSVESDWLRCCRRRTALDAWLRAALPVLLSWLYMDGGRIRSPQAWLPSDLQLLDSWSWDPLGPVAPWSRTSPGPSVVLPCKVAVVTDDGALNTLLESASFSVKHETP